MFMPIKVGVCIYVMYTNCQTLDDLNILLEEDERLCLIIVNIRVEETLKTVEWFICKKVFLCIINGSIVSKQQNLQTCNKFQDTPPSHPSSFGHYKCTVFCLQVSECS